MTGAPPPPPPPPPPGGGPPPPPSGPPGHPGPPGAPFGAGGPVAQQQGTNGLAIASLVLGLLSIPLCFIFIPAVLAIVFGFVALSQTSSSGQKGRGMAISGVILGAISVLIIVAAIVFAGSIDIDTSMALRR